MEECGFIRAKMQRKLEALSGETLQLGDIQATIDNPQTMYRLIDATTDFDQAYIIAKIFGCLTPTKSSGNKEYSGHVSTY